jgi:hypothetical protein
MKLVILIAFYVSGLISCRTETQNKEHEASGVNYSLKTVELALEVTTKIETNKEVTPKEWNMLFNSKGYENYFCAFDRVEMEPKLKEAFYLVFDKSNSETLDSILKIPVSFDPSGQFNMIVKNFNAFKTNRGALKKFIAETDFEQLFIDAKTQTYEYLPEKAKAKAVELHEVNFILMEPNAYVTDCGIVVDLNNAYNMGLKNLQSLLAHEYHHDYRNTFLSIPNDVLMRQLSDLQAEGIADLIDKEKPPWKEMKGFPKSMIDHFNEMYKRTPDKLKALDSLTTSLVKGRMTKEELDLKMNRFFVDGGHANGLYMSVKIVEAGLKAQMIETFNDPIAFINLYNQAVSNLPSEYAFSYTFKDYITKLKDKR